MRTPVSTYRLQIRPSFTLQDAAKLTGYLHNLGIDWVYVSPILTAEENARWANRQGFNGHPMDADTWTPIGGSEVEVRAEMPVDLHAGQMEPGELERPPQHGEGEGAEARLLHQSALDLEPCGRQEAEGRPLLHRSLGGEPGRQARERRRGPAFLVDLLPAISRLRGVHAVEHEWEPPCPQTRTNHALDRERKPDRPPMASMEVRASAGLVSNRCASRTRN